MDVKNDDPNILAAVTFYDPLVKRLNLLPGHYVPYKIQADETGCNPEPEYCRRRRLILQLCDKIWMMGRPIINVISIVTHPS